MSLQLRLPPVPASEQNYVIGLQHWEHHGIAARLLKKEWKYWSVNDKKSLEKALRQSHEELEIQSARFLLENVPGFAESQRVNFASREKTSDTLEAKAACLAWSYGESVLQASVRPASTRDSPLGATKYSLVGDYVKVLCRESGQSREFGWQRHAYGSADSIGVSKSWVNDDLTSLADSWTSRLNAGIGAESTDSIMAESFDRHVRPRQR
jgi:hypothetical protein